MVKLTTGYLFKRVSGKNQQQPRKKDEADLDYLRRITHLRLQSQFIDKIANIPECESVVVLYLQNNLLRKIQNLEYFPKLTHLYLQHNSISKIENLSQLIFLRKLYLGNNEISVVEGLEGLENLVELHLENQRLPQGETFYFDPRTLSQLQNSLKVLNISNNNISSIRCLSELRSLSRLIVENNQLCSLDDLMETLSGLPMLQALDADGNPIASERKFFNLAVIASKSLTTLNGRKIDEKTRVFITNLAYGLEYRKKGSSSMITSCDLNKLPSQTQTFHSLEEVTMKSSRLLGSKLFPVLKTLKDGRFKNVNLLKSASNAPFMNSSVSYHF